MTYLEQKDLLTHACWESRFNPKYGGQFTPVDLFLHGAAKHPDRPGVQLHVGKHFLVKSKAPRQSQWKMADPVVQVTEPANEANLEARRVVAARHLAGDVAIFKSPTKAKTKVDGRTTAGKKRKVTCSGGVPLVLEPSLYGDEKTPVADLKDECAAHGVPHSAAKDATKEAMAKALKAHHKKFHAGQKKKKNDGKSLESYFRNLIAENEANEGGSQII